MAIFWCDPYIESPSGGVDGTTGSGTLGSYSNPYSLDNMPSGPHGQSGYNVITNGDEVRLKALPANPWLTDPLLAWYAGDSSNYGVWFAAAPDQHSFIKYTSRKGEKTYLSWNTPNRAYTRSMPATWQSSSPKANTLLPAYKLDPQYYLSNLVNPNKEYLLYTGTGEVTITAGWVSETARGGETIIHRIGMTHYKETWFGYSPYSDNTVVDAPELTISHSTTGSNKYIVIHGKTVEVHDIIERSGKGSGGFIQIRASATFKANSLVSAGYIDIYGPYHDTSPTQGINRDIRHILNGYYMSLRRVGSVANRLKFKTFLTNYIDQADPTQFDYYDDFYFYMGSFNGSRGALTEMAVDPAVNLATVFEFSGSMGSLAPVLNALHNYSYRTNNREPIVTSGGYLANGAKIDSSRGDVYFRDLVLPTGDTLENTTSHNVKSSQYATWTNFHGKAWGVDRNSGRRVAFSRTVYSAQEMMMMYNSTEYNNKLVHHIMPTPNYGYCYDRVYIDMPTGVSEIAANTNLRIKYTLGGAVSTGVKLGLQLEGNTISSSWAATGAYNTLIQPSDGGEGTVIYSDTFTSGTSSSTSNIVGAQQLLGVLKLGHQAANPTGVAKICIDSIELEVV